MLPYCSKHLTLIQTVLLTHDTKHIWDTIFIEKDHVIHKVILLVYVLDTWDSVKTNKQTNQTKWNQTKPMKKKKKKTEPKTQTNKNPPKKQKGKTTENPQKQNHKKTKPKPTKQKPKQRIPNQIFMQ